MQWVSTFASGASSLGRPRRLAGHRLNQVHQAPRGTFGENSPHIYKEHPEGKNGEKIFGAVTVSEESINGCLTAGRIKLECASIPADCPSLSTIPFRDHSKTSEDARQRPPHFGLSRLEWRSWELGIISCAPDTDFGWRPTC